MEKIKQFAMWICRGIDKFWYWFDYDDFYPTPREINQWRKDNDDS